MPQVNINLIHTLMRPINLARTVTVKLWILRADLSEKRKRVLVNNQDRLNRSGKNRNSRQPFAKCKMLKKAEVGSRGSVQVTMRGLIAH